jgi:hypothetical protein
MASHGDQGQFLESQRVQCPRPSPVPTLSVGYYEPALHMSLLVPSPLELLYSGAYHDPSRNSLAQGGPRPSQVAASRVPAM